MRVTKVKETFDIKISHFIRKLNTSGRNWLGVMFEVLHFIAQRPEH